MCKSAFVRVFQDSPRIYKTRHVQGNKMDTLVSRYQILQWFSSKSVKSFRKTLENSKNLRKTLENCGDEYVHHWCR
jgi:uncharacterized protein VirK/YbjX